MILVMISAADDLPLAIDEAIRKTPPAMEPCPNERFCSLGRFFLAALLALAAGPVLALVAAALLSVAPGWHERLHPDATTPHLCVVTLFASGHCESATTAPVFSPPDALPVFASRPRPAASFLSTAHFCSLLEHAPPAFA